MKMPSTITLPLSSPPTTNGPTPSGLAQTSRLEILYEIHLHPTYRVPTLWFSLTHFPEGEEPFNIDTIYKYLVPEHDFKKIRVSGSGVHISLAVGLLSKITPISVNLTELSNILSLMPRRGLSIPVAHLNLLNRIKTMREYIIISACGLD